MDEIDGMSCGDKGGLHELFHIIKQNTHSHQHIAHPVICISNRPYDKKISQDLYQEFQLRYPSEKEISKRLRFICKKENVHMDDECLQFIVHHGNYDIRRTIHFLQEIVFSVEQTSRVISMDDIHKVIYSSSCVQTDFNTFDATRNVFHKPLTKQCILQYYNNDPFMMSMMIFENLPEQLLSKKTNTRATVNHYVRVLHHMCVLDHVENIHGTYSTTPNAFLCCGYANRGTNTPDTTPSNKNIVSTNTLTKLANQTYITGALVVLSKQIQLPIASLHQSIPILVHHIVMYPSDVKYLQISYYHVEKIIQIYNKWMSELGKKEKTKCVKIIPRLKKKWKELLIDLEQSV